MTGPVAVVSGGSHGVGRAIVVGLAGRGWTVVLLHSPGGGAAAEEALAELRVHAPLSSAVPVDVADERKVSAAFGAVLAERGRLDAVVHLAGFLVTGPIGDLDLAVLDRLHSTVVRGAFVLCREAGRALGPGGRILLSSSAAVPLALPGTAVYVAAKAAVEALAGVLARELEPRGIVVAALSAGPTSGEVALGVPVLPDDEVAATALGFLLGAAG